MARATATRGGQREMYRLVIAVDFDGTIVEHRYPHIGEERPFATQTLRLLSQSGHRLILWTVREGALLDAAVEWCSKRGVEFYAINRDYPEEQPTDSGRSRKIKAQLFIDDRNLGALPEWGEIYKMIESRRPHTPLDSCEKSEMGRSLYRRFTKWLSKI